MSERASIMYIKIAIKFKQTSVPKVVGYSNEQWLEVALGVSRKSASKTHRVNATAS